MRHFAGRSRISALPLPARVVYSFFIFYMVLGLLSSLLLYQDGIGWTPEQVTTWYRGDEAAMTFPKTYRQMMETFHFHLFTVPVCYLIVAHLYMLCDVPPRRKMGWIVGGFVASLAHLLAPWVAWQWPAPAGWVMPLTGGAFLLTWGVMLLRPLWDMWGPGPRAGAQPVTLPLE